MNSLKPSTAFFVKIKIIMISQYPLLSSWAPILAGLVTLLLTRFMLRSQLFAGIKDIPNARSLHSAPTPRVGGLALMLGVFAGWHLLHDQGAAVLYATSAALMLLSLLDDLRGLPARWRLLVHIMVAAGFIVYGFEPLPNHLVVVLLLGVVWMTNLYNFMDGANGLAGGMAVLGFGFYTLAAALAGDFNFALMNLVIVGSSLVFLTFNFGKAKVFMGDAGSVPLGFLAAAIGLFGWQRGFWPLWFPVMIFSSFFVDATVTLLKRVLRGERVWEAHREHYYQRLIRMGWSHSRLALVEYTLMVASGTVAILALHLPTPYVIGLLAMCLLVMLGLMRLVDLGWRRYG